MLTGFRLVSGILNILGVIVIWGLIIWGIIWLVKYLKRGRQEQQLLRLELGKLADELERMRKKNEPG